MRRRATFITSQTSSFDPSEIQLKADQLLHPGLRAAREERLTFGFNELPLDVVDVLKQSHEVHIRWTSAVPYNVSSPFLSSIAPGLHVHYTPLKQYQNDLLCQSLREMFSTKLACKSTKDSFTQPSLVSKRFASSASLQFYQALSKPTRFVAYIQRKICQQSDVMCFHRASLLNAAEYIDIDYDSISHTLVVTAFWAKPLANYYDPIGQMVFENQWPLDISTGDNDKVEVGFLKSTKATDAHELQLDGFLAIVGEDEKPKSTLFSFPSRHHQLPPTQSLEQEYGAAFVQPAGLHPIFEITFADASKLTPPANKPEDSVCALHAYFTLPSAVFADQYAFPTSTPDPLFEEANHIHLLRSISGELDLEAPDYVIDKWGSTMLLELSTPSSLESSLSATTAGPQGSLKTKWKITIPLHLRYLPPSHVESSSHHRVNIPWPNVFWACTAEDGTKFPVNPFDRVNLGYDSLFGPRTMFYHLRGQPNLVARPSIPSRSGKPESDRSGTLMASIDVPVMNTARIGGDHVVEWGTLIVVLLGFAWVAAKMLPTLIDMSIGLLGRPVDPVANTGTRRATKRETKVDNNKKQE